MRRMVLAALGVLFVGMLAGCAGSPPAGVTPAPSPQSGAASAPPTRAPSPAPSISAEAAVWDGTVSYPDGVEVQLVADETRTIEETGAGAITGRQARTITVELTNGGGQALDLNRVDVTLQVGDVAAEPYPSQDEQTFAGTAQPGATAVGTYSFLLPAGEAQTVTVDFDDQYAAAVFRA